MYDLRKNKNAPGFYRNLHYGLNVFEDAASPTQAQAQAQKPSLRIKDDLRQLSNAILMKLKSSTTKSPLIRASFVPSPSFINYLIGKYSVKGTFIDGSLLLSDNSLPVRRFFNKHDYCCIYENSFMFRLSNGKSLNYFVDNNLTSKTIKTKPTFHFKFVVDARKFI